jgi:hypothetical protein
MGRTEGLLFQDLIRLTSLDSAIYAEEGGTVKFYLCTESFLAESGLRWTDQEQRYHLNSLATKGYITVQMRGFPKRRWICIEWDVVARAILQASGGSRDQWRHQLGTKPPDWTPEASQSGGKPPVQSGGKPRLSQAVNRPSEGRKTASQSGGKPPIKENEEEDRTDGDRIERERLSPTPAASPLSGGTTVFSSDIKSNPSERPTLTLIPTARDTTPLPSSASPPPSRKVKVPRDLSWADDNDLAEMAAEDAERKERRARKKAKRDSFYGDDVPDPEWDELIQASMPDAVASLVTPKSPSPPTVQKTRKQKATNDSAAGPLLGDDSKNSDPVVADWVKQIYDALSLARRLRRPPNLALWRESFQALRVMQPDDEIAFVLKWFCVPENMSDPHTPQACSGTAFCEDYVRIRLAMGRHKDKGW